MPLSRGCGGDRKGRGSECSVNLKVHRENGGPGLQPERSLVSGLSLEQFIL